MKITVIRQHALSPWLLTLAEWRIAEFRNFPYLYDGNLEYEAGYTQAYARTNQSIMIVAQDKAGALLGLLTGTPLIAEKSVENASVIESFKSKNLHAEQWYYLGEIIVHANARQMGVAKSLMLALRHEHLRMGFLHCALLCVKRESNHPLRPLQYSPPDPLWLSMGYKKLDINTDFEWPTIQSVESGEVKSVKCKNTMEFWGYSHT